MADLGEWKAFKRRRVQMGLTQEALANLLGVHVQTVAGWTRGTRRITSADIIAQIEKLMNLKVPEKRTNLWYNDNDRRFGRKPHDEAKPKEHKFIDLSKKRKLNRDDLDFILRLHYRKNMNAREIAFMIHRDCSIIEKIIKDAHEIEAEIKQQGVI